MGERKYEVDDLVNIKTKVLEVDKSSETGLGYRVRIGMGRSVWVGEYMLDSNKTYEQGLEEGWNLVKKIQDMTYERRNKIFGTNPCNNSLNDIIGSFTVVEVKEKIEEYERLNSFNVGDVVNVNGYLKGIITYVYSDNDFDILLDNGITRTHEKASNCEKINKHIDICEILNKF